MSPSKNCSATPSQSAGANPSPVKGRSLSRARRCLRRRNYQGLSIPSPAQSIAVPQAASHKHEEELAALRAQAAQLQDQYLRSRAELDNFRKRTAKEREEQRKFAGESIIKSLLETVDNLERAIQGAEKSNDVKALHSGVEMIHHQFVTALKGQGVEIIDPKPRDKFDPAKHQAVTGEVSPGFEPETIIEVLQKGYLLHGRVLRAAMVRAALR